MVNIRKDVPFSLGEVDAGWLSTALTEAGLLKDETVTGFDHHVVGEETGFLGEIAILKPQYSGDTQAPNTLVLKIPTPLKNRVMGQTMGAYEKEIRFYAGLRDDLNIRTPRYYYGAMSAADDPDVVLARLHKLREMPAWLVAILGLLVQWIFGLMPRRYALLIEDLSHLRLGDQQAGCSRTDRELAVKTMARLHAQFWDSDALTELKWVQPVDMTANILHLVYSQAVGKYRKANEDSLEPRQLRMLDWLDENGIRLNEVIGSEPRTLLHGDYRLDNLCFDDEKGELLLMDWQTLVSGSAGMDLAYFLSTAVPTGSPDAEIDDLISLYRTTLVEEGIEVSEGRIRWMYEVGMLATLHRIAPVMFQEHLEMGASRGPEIMNNWVEQIYEKLRDVDFEHILDNRPA